MRKIAKGVPLSRAYLFIEANLSGCLDIMAEYFGTRSAQLAFEDIGRIAAYNSWHPFEIIDAYRFKIPALKAFVNTKEGIKYGRQDV